MCGYCPTYKELVAERFLTAPDESHIILSKSIFIALKATERKETKCRSKFSLSAFQASAIMILTSRKLCGEGFLPRYPLDLLQSPISEIK